MKSKDGKKCLDAFPDEYRCQRPEGHRGKHWDDSGDYFVMWTPAGKARVLREREEQKEKQSPTGGKKENNDNESRNAGSE